jgi:hypothetical protein
MSLRDCLKSSVCLLALIACFGSPAEAQLGMRLSSYTGRNAPGYLEPLVDAFGADLNAGLAHSARIPRSGLHVSLEVNVMSARFSAGDRTFRAVTEGGFAPETSIEAPTVIGPEEAVVVDGESGTHFWFPGGFNLRSFDFAAPQLRVGSIYGTEALIRLGFLHSNSEDIGNFSLYGFGVRHSVSQYFNRSPIDIAVGAYWQRFTVGDKKGGGDLLSAEAWSAGVQMSKRLNWLEPYGEVAYDDFGFDLSYEGDTPEDAVAMSLDSGDHFHMTLGLSVNLSFFLLYGEYNSGGQDAFALGLALGYHPLR